MRRLATSLSGMGGHLHLLTIITLSLQGRLSLTSENSRALSVSLWRVFPDTAVFDWYITLAEKYKMVTCNLTYGPRGDDNGTKRVTQFLPKHRSFSLLNLEQNTSYSFLMTCSDREDNLWSSEKINFDTGVVISSVDPKLGAIFSPRRQEIESANRDIRSKYIMGRYKSRSPVSPHTLMGASSAVIGLIITATTLGLVARRYVRAEPIKMPKEEEVLETLPASNPAIALECYNSGGSLSSATSCMDIETLVDAAYSGPAYSFTEGEADVTAVPGINNVIF